MSTHAVREFLYRSTYCTLDLEIPCSPAVTMWCVPVARKCNAARVEMSGGRGHERSVALSKLSIFTRNRIVSGKNRYRSRTSNGDNVSSGFARSRKTLLSIGNNAFTYRTRRRRLSMSAILFSYHGDCHQFSIWTCPISMSFSVSLIANWKSILDVIWHRFFLWTPSLKTDVKHWKSMSFDIENRSQFALWTRALV